MASAPHQSGVVEQATKSATRHVNIFAVEPVSDEQPAPIRLLVPLPKCEVLVRTSKTVPRTVLPTAKGRMQETESRKVVQPV